jgi:hypothetical protein
MPNKNSHPDLTVLAVSGFLLGSIKKSKFESYSDLLEKLNYYDARANILFKPSLQLLFLLGLVDYHRKNDLIEYVGP